MERHIHTRSADFEEIAKPMERTISFDMWEKHVTFIKMKKEVQPEINTKRKMHYLGKEQVTRNANSNGRIIDKLYRYFDSFAV